MDNMRTALELMADGKVDPLGWVQRFPIERGVEAFERMLAARGDDIKAVIVPA
jgi:threonine dehydrogenase-like Zn-dependent dehydrogenase